MTEFYKKRLKNGATILFEKRNLPVVAIVAATRAGAAYEFEKNKGIAHFTEHMLFKGSKNRGQQEISSAIEKVGGVLNGFTSEQITAYWCKMPSRHAALGADVIFDMFSNPKFDAKELEKEKGVIVSEIRRIHDMPQQWLFDKIKELLYKKPFALPIAGSEKTVTSFNRDTFVGWHDRFYGSENLIISVVGKANFEEIVSFVEKYFKPYKKQMPMLDLRTLNKNLEFIEKRKDIDQAHLVLAFNAPKLSTKERYPAEIFNSILGSGMSSWLFQEVREKRGWAYSIKSFLEAERDYGHCIVYAGIDKKNLKNVKAIALKEIKRFRELKSRDFDEAKEQCIGNWQIDMEDSEKTAAGIILQEIATQAEDFYEYDEKISDVRLEDVKKFGKLKNYAFAAVIPK